MNLQRIHFRSISCVCFAVLLSGCGTFEGWTGSGSSNASQTSSEYSYLEEQVRVLNAKVAGLEQSNANLQRDLNETQAKLNQLQAAAGGQASATEVQQLRAQVQAMEAQREKDKQVILDQVAKEIAGVAATKRARATTEPTAAATNDVGYEHIVKQGQTLTDIARAYGVTIAAIKKANNLNSDMLHIGQKLFIPKTK